MFEPSLESAWCWSFFRKGYDVQINQKCELSMMELGKISEGKNVFKSTISIMHFHYG